MAIRSMNKVQEHAVQTGIDLDRLPAHIAMIMDGNGRFAQSQGFTRLWGHRKGYKTLRSVLMDSSELGIKFLTVYAFSAENWKRPKDEVDGLMELIERSMRDEIPTMMRNNVRMRVTGRQSDLPDSLQDAIRLATETTAQNTGITFVLAVNYGGRAEIVDACKSLVNEGLSADQITEEAIRSRMYTPEIPDPDLIVRTAGEMRWSNFLLYQGAYSELFVTDTTWPEFGLEQLLQAVKTFQTRRRKFGGL